MSSAPKILLTGFNPFAGADRNPSETVVGGMADQPGLVREILPTEYAAAERRIVDLLEQHRPAFWIGLGLNQRARSILLERTAVNLDDARLPDNAGDERRDRPIDPAGPGAYPSTLPLAEMFGALTRANVPVDYSDSAGRFVCNHVFYAAARAVERLGLHTLAGFIHIPWPGDWAGDAALPDPRPGLSVISDAVAVCVTACKDSGSSSKQFDKPTPRAAR